MKNQGTITLDEKDTEHIEGLDNLYQIVLFNDDVNSFDFVINCLSKTFGYDWQLSTKIAVDAHKNGKTICAVEDKNSALKHKGELQSYGLTVEIEPI